MFVATSVSTSSLQDNELLPSGVLGRHTCRRAAAKFSMKNVEFVSKGSKPQQKSGFTKINSFHNYSRVGVSSDANV